MTRCEKHPGAYVEHNHGEPCPLCVQLETAPMGAQFKHAAIHIEDGVTEIVALDDGGRLWWNMQNSDASWQHWSMLPPHPDSVGRESPDDDDDNQAQTGFNRGVSPDGRPCYMHRLGWLQEDRTSPPDVGQIAEAWRPASHGTARVTHVATDSDGVSWIWFESDNRWFPDRGAYPDSPFVWKPEDE